MNTFFIFVCCIYLVSSASIEIQENFENQPENNKRDVFSYFWMTEEAKYKLFVQSLMDEFKRKLKDQEEAELEKKNEMKQKIYRDRLANRVSGTVLRDFLTLRY